jgi:hypothetical protein
MTEAEVERLLTAAQGKRYHTVKYNELSPPRFKNLWRV